MSPLWSKQIRLPNALFDCIGNDSQMDMYTYAYMDESRIKGKGTACSLKTEPEKVMSHKMTAGLLCYHTNSIPSNFLSPIFVSGKRILPSILNTKI